MENKAEDTDSTSRSTGTESEKTLSSDSTILFESGKEADSSMSSNENIKDATTADLNSGRHRSKIFKNIRSFWKNFFKRKSKKKVQATTELNLEEGVGLESSNLTSAAPCPEGVSPTASVCSSEDIRDESKADISSVPLELADNVHENITSERGLTGSSPAEHLIKTSSVTHLEGSHDDSVAVGQLTGLKAQFYTIIEGFFGSLTKEQWLYINNGVYYKDVREKVVEMGVDVLTVFIQAIIDTLSEASHQSFASSQVCQTEAVNQESPTELFRQTFGITDKNIDDSLTLFGKVFCDEAGGRFHSLPRRFRVIVTETISEKVGSILSETITGTVERESPIVCANCCQLSSCTACKKMLARVIESLKNTHKGFLIYCTITAKKHEDDISTGACTIKSKRRRSGCFAYFAKLRKNKVPPCSSEKVTLDSIKEENPTLEETGNIPPPHSISKFPSSLSENQTKERSSSSQQCSDINVRNTAVSENKDKKASAQDETVQAERPSLLRRIWLFYMSKCPWTRY